MDIKHWLDWDCDVVATLLFVIDGEQVLLIRKKRGLGAGKINGPGGKCLPGESFADCALRETREETGIQAGDPEAAGILCFRFADGLLLRVHVFVAGSHTGTAVETDEAAPFWCPVDGLPLDDMWADDRLWLPTVLGGGHALAHCLFREDKLLSHKIHLGEGRLPLL